MKKKAAYLKFVVNENRQIGLCMQLIKYGIIGLHRMRIGKGNNRQKQTIIEHFVIMDFILNRIASKT